MTRVAIYSAISGENENLRVARSMPVAAKLAARRAYDEVIWRTAGEARLDAWAYEDRTNSNVGDMAIRIAVEKLLSASGLGSATGFLEVQWGELNDTLIETINATCAMFVIAGSGYFHLNEAGECSERLAQDLAALQRIKTPKVVFGAGVNVNTPNLESSDIKASPTAAATFEAVLKEAALVGVRDSLSQKILQPLTKSPVRVVVDPALLFSEIVQGASGRLVGGDEQCRIGLNFGFQSHYSSALLRDNLASYCELLERLQRKHNPQFMYFVHTDPERLVPKLLGARGFPMTPVTGSPETLCDAYGTLDVHICQMLHSSILAMSRNTPTINMAYDIKNKGFFELMQLERLCVPIQPLDIDQVESLVDSSLRDQDTLRSHIAARRQDLAKDLVAFADECATLALANRQRAD